MAGRRPALPAVLKSERSAPEHRDRRSCPLAALCAERVRRRAAPRWPRRRPGLLVLEVDHSTAPQHRTSGAARRRCENHRGLRRDRDHAGAVRRGTYGRASSTRLNGVSVARRNFVNPPPPTTTSRSRASPALAPSAGPLPDSDTGPPITEEEPH